MVTTRSGVIGPIAVSRVVVEFKLVLETAPIPLQEAEARIATAWVLQKELRNAVNGLVVSR